jgi:MYXO-CTERM domain-containing protein
MVRSKVVPWVAGILGLFATLGAAREARAQGWQPGPKLTSPTGMLGDYFGRSLAFSDGRILAGAFGLDAGGLDSVGAAYLFSGANFDEVTRIDPATPKKYWGFGDSVALDGKTAMFGESPLDNTSVHVFELADGTWTEKQLLHEADSTFGYNMVVRGDTAVIGSPKSGADVGKVHVYRKQDGLWAETQELTASDALESDFFSISLDFDGETVVVGAPGNALYPGRHGAYVYAKSGDQFVEQAHLTYTTDRDLYFGGSVSVSGDTIAVGATFKDGPGEGLIYARKDGQWSLQQSLTQATEERFGGNAHVQGDMAWFAGSSAMQGSLYVYQRANGVWTQSEQLVVPSDKYGSFGSLAVGGTLLVGVYEADTTGFVQVFTNPAEAAKAPSQKAAAGKAEEKGCNVALAGSGTPPVGAAWLVAALALWRARRPRRKTA